MKKSLFLMLFLIIIFANYSMAEVDNEMIIDASSSGSYVIKNDNTLWGWGGNKYGSLGIGNTNYQKEPVKISDNVKYVHGSTRSTCFIKLDGSLWAMGNNDRNKFGIEEQGKILSPVKISENVKKVFSSNYTTLIIKENDTLWYSGDNPYTGDRVDTFTQLLPNQKFKYVYKTEENIFFITLENKLYAAGRNQYGVLGLGHKNAVNEPKKVLDSVLKVSGSDSTMLFLLENGDVYATGVGYNKKMYFDGKLIDTSENSVLSPKKVTDKVKNIDSTGKVMLFLKNDSSLVGWGYNRMKLFNSNSETNSLAKISDNVRNMSLGERHLILVKKDNTLFNGGENYRGGIAGYSNGSTKNYPLEKVLDEVKTLPDDWAQEEVKEAIENELIPIELQGNYQAPITRKEFASLVVKMIEKKSNKSIKNFILENDYELVEESPFTDANDFNINCAYSLKIVNGIGNNEYAPNRIINRQEAAKMLTSTSSVLGFETKAPMPEFSDNELISNWAKPFIGYMKKIGVMNGVGNNKFDPKGTYVRQMAFVTMNRIFKNLR